MPSGMPHVHTLHVHTVERTKLLACLLHARQDGISTLPWTLPWTTTPSAHSSCNNQHLAFDDVARMRCTVLLSKAPYRRTPHLKRIIPQGSSLIAYAIHTAEMLHEKSKQCFSNSSLMAVGQCCFTRMFRHCTLMCQKPASRACVAHHCLLHTTQVTIPSQRGPWQCVCAICHASNTSPADKRVYR